MNDEVEQQAFIGIGSNQGEPVAEVNRAFKALDALPATRLVEHSSLYRTRPVGPQDQPHYINAVARLQTRLSARQLLAHLQDIEHKAGRIRSAVQWGPRVLDLDILAYANEVVDDSDYTLPHPEIPQRAFVLVPLLEIEPECELPIFGRARDLLEKIGSEGVVKYEEPENND